jgi:apolipoprotein N-acyltransferase
VQHVQIATLRCVENRLPMARSVNTGISGFIDSVGRVGRLVEVDGRVQQVAGFATQRIMLDPRQTVFGRLGAAPAVGVALVTAVLALSGLLRRKKKKPKRI